MKNHSIFRSLLVVGAFLAGAATSYSQPVANAATPSHPANTVLAMYDSSGVYPEVPVDDWIASWSSAYESSYTIPGGNAVLLYTSLQYAGVEFYNSDQIDTTKYNTMHVDVWTPNANQFGVQLVSTNGGTQAAQINFTPASGTIVSNTWIGLDIPLSQFATVNPALQLNSLVQLLWIDNQGNGVMGGTFYIDNVYFWSNNVSAPPPLQQPTNNAATPSQPSGSVLAMYNSSGVYTDVPVDDWLASWSGANEFSYTVTNTGKVVLEYTGLEFAGVEFYTPDQLNVTSYNTMHVDVWTPNANQFGIQLVSTNGGTQAGQVNFTPASGAITSNQWISLNIPLSQFTTANPNLLLNNLQQLLWIDNQGGGVTDGTFYIDNVYFYSVTAAASPLITATRSGGNLDLTFTTQMGFNYTVQYKTNVNDPTWQTLSAVPGNGSSQTVPDPVSNSRRFYRLSVQ